MSYLPLEATRFLVMVYAAAADPVPLYSLFRATAVALLWFQRL